MRRGQRRPSIETLAVHSGYVPSEGNPSVAPPLSQSVAYIFDDTEDAKELFAGAKEGFVYGRVTNPTVDVFQKRIAHLEGAEAALGTASGMAATFLIVACFLRPFEENEIVSSDRVYGGTFDLFNRTLKRFGVTVRFVKDPHDINSWESEITKHTRFLFVETPSNPRMELFDLKEIALLAHAHNLPAVCDSTIATPVLQRPMEFGIDIVMHSATKFIDGHGDAMGGVVLASKKVIDDMRSEVYCNLGPALSPFHAWLFCRGLETLSIRMKAYSKNAVRIAKFLAQHPKVKAVYYPGLKSSPYYTLMQKQMAGYASSLMTFEIDGSMEEAARFIESLELITHAANLGDNKTLVLYPAATSHHQLSDEELKRVGISKTMIRLSVGLEDPKDLIYDISQAFDKSFSKKYATQNNRTSRHLRFGQGDTS